MSAANKTFLFSLKYSSIYESNIIVLPDPVGACTNISFLVPILVASNNLFTVSSWNFFNLISKVIHYRDTLLIHYIYIRGVENAVISTFAEG